jgi:hypothetical protein
MGSNLLTEKLGQKHVAIPTIGSPEAKEWRPGDFLEGV